MNIAYLCADRGIPVLGDKGASVHVRELTTALANLGHNITLLCAKRGAGNSCPPVDLVELPPIESIPELEREAARRDILLCENDKVLRREVGKLAHDRGLAARTLEVLKDRGVRPAAVYERYALFHRAGREIANALGVPLVLEVNAPLSVEEQKYRALRLTDLAHNLETRAWREADRIVAVSDAVRDCACARGVERERITVLHNGVDSARFHPEIDGRSVRQHYGLHGRQVIGFIGSLKPWHGVDFLLDAWPLLKQRFPRACALVVGDGPMIDSLRERIARDHLLSEVIVTGRVSHGDVPSYLAAMDLTVAPYVKQDGFYFSPLKVVESLASGRPVVAPMLGQLPHLIANGETGLLYSPGDLESFIEATALLLGDPGRLRAMSREAGRSAHANFSWQATACRVVELMTSSCRRLDS
jgi:glycosyltransferase involved in cell wall biosynthesis